MIAQDTLARHFAAGNDPSSIESASNVTVEPTGVDGYDAVIVGYGHAVYAARRTDGSIILFEGWRGRSVSTTQHITKLRTGFRQGGPTEVDTDSEARPDRGTFAGYDLFYPEESDTDEVSA